MVRLGMELYKNTLILKGVDGQDKKRQTPLIRPVNSDVFRWAWRVPVWVNVQVRGKMFPLPTKHPWACKCWQSLVGCAKQVMLRVLQESRHSDSCRLVGSVKQSGR